VTLPSKDVDSIHLRTLGSRIEPSPNTNSATHKDSELWMASLLVSEGIGLR